MEEDPSLTTPDVGPREPLWQPAGGAAAATAWEVRSERGWAKHQTVPSRSLSRQMVGFAPWAGQPGGQRLQQPGGCGRARMPSVKPFTPAASAALRTCWRSVVGGGAGGGWEGSLV